MAFKTKTDTGGGDLVKFEKYGDSVEGVYLGSTAFEGKFGPTLKHLLKTKTGLRTVFAKSNSQLTSLLQSEEGNTVRITYTDEKRTGKGNPMKVYTLAVDESIPRDLTNAIPSNEDDSEYGDDDEADDEPIAARAPTMAASARKEELQKILNRKRN